MPRKTNYSNERRAALKRDRPVKKESFNVLDYVPLSALVDMSSKAKGKMKKSIDYRISIMRQIESGSLEELSNLKRRATEGELKVFMALIDTAILRKMSTSPSSEP